MGLGLRGRGRGAVVRGAWLLAAVVLGPSRASAAAEAPASSAPEVPRSSEVALEEGELEEGQLELVADTLQLEEERIVGVGGVTLRFGDQAGTAASFTYDRRSRELSLLDGTWSRPEGSTRFTEAHLDLDADTGLVVRARFEGSDGRLQLTGERAWWDEPRRLRGEAVEVRTCGCEVPPWSVEARSVDVVLDEEIRFRGGWIRVCARRLVPVPLGSVPLSGRRSGLLPPEVGYGRDGLLLRQPAALVLGPHADLRLEPEWRSARSLRGLLSLRNATSPHDGGTLRAAAGWDRVTGSARGAAQVEQGHAQGPWRAAVSGDWWSDATYLSDYGGDFLSRRAPWSEVLAVAGAGPLRLEHQSVRFAGAEGLDQRPLGAVLSAPGLALGPLQVAARARVDTLARGAGSLALEDVEARGGGLLTVDAGQELGPVRLEGGLRGAAWAREEAAGWSEPWTELRGRAALRLDSWADLGPLRAVGDWGLEAEVAEVEGAVDTVLFDELAGPAWRLGPALRGRLLAAAAVPLAGEARLGWSDRGLWPEATARAGLGQWSGRLQADPAIQDLRLGWSDGRLALEAGTLRHESLWQVGAGAGWQLPGPLRELRPAYRGLAAVDTWRLLSHGPSLSWVSRCDCVEAGLAAAWAADRAVPDVRLDLRVY